MPDFTPIKPQACLNCGYVATVTRNVCHGEEPIDGAVFICIECAHIHVFEAGRVRNPTAEEIIDMAGHPDLVSIIEAIGRAKKMRALGRPLAAERTRPWWRRFTG
jgi:hypothetical protein